VSKLSNTNVHNFVKKIDFSLLFFSKPYSIVTLAELEEIAEEQEGAEKEEKEGLIYAAIIDR